MATIKDISKDTGLGIATISKYLNGGNVREENKLLIENSIKKFGYTVNYVARGLKTNKTNTVGVIIPDLNNIFITSIVSIIDEVLRKKGYMVYVCDCHNSVEQENSIVKQFLEKRVDGIICMPVSESSDTFEAVFAAGIPLVLIDRMIPNLNNRANAVLVDNVKAASLATDLLIDSGCRDIAIVLGPENVYTCQQRHLGYCQSMIQHGFTPSLSRILYSDYSVNGGYETVKRLLLTSPPDALFLTNYEMTLGGIIAINELGVSIPKDISVIGFDNMQLSQLIQPKLTIVTQPLEEIGKYASELILKKMSQDSDSDKCEILILSPSVYMGDSVKG